jgi:hypothetical protein
MARRAEAQETTAITNRVALRDRLGRSRRCFLLSSIMLLALTFAGCATQQQHAENAAATRAALDAADEAKCADQGLQKETNQFAECLLQLEQARQTQGAANAPISLTPPPAQNGN